LRRTGSSEFSARALPREWSGCAVRVTAVWLVGLLLLGAGPSVAQEVSPLREWSDAEGSTGVAYFDAIEAGGGEGFDVDLFVRFETSTGQPLELPAGPDWPFVIRQDGEPIPAESITVRELEQTRQGVACAVVIDVSPTMSGVIESVRSAVLSFMDQLGADDEVALVTASGEPLVYAGFETSVDEMRVLVEALETELEPRPTRLLDAIDLAIERMRSDASLPPRRFLLVVSDGGDGGSARSLEQVVEAASPLEDVRIPVYGVILRDPAFGTRVPPLLADLGTRTGGASLNLLRATDLPLTAAFYDDLWRRMRRSQVLRYQASMDGERHSVELIMDGLVQPSERVLEFPERFWLPWQLLVIVPVGLVCAAALLLALRRRRRAGCLVMVGAGMEGVRFPLRRGLNDLGSQSDNDIVIPAATVSRMHAILRVSRSGVEIEDRNSTNGTLVNDKPIHISPLFSGDHIRVGDVDLRYER